MPNATKTFIQNNLPNFMKKQYEFAAYLRDPDNNPKPSQIDNERLALYRELLYNNIEDFIAQQFPVIRSILSDSYWQQLVNDYFAKHKAKSPIFRDIPQEFIDYLIQERDTSHDPAFLIELAHYEWMETKLFLSNDKINWQHINQQGDLYKNIPFISPLAYCLEYHFEVHKICVDYQPIAMNTTPIYLIVYRNRNDVVNFMEINAVTARLIQIIKTDNCSGQLALQQIAKELNHSKPDNIINNGKKILQDLFNADIILGIKKN